MILGSDTGIVGSAVSRAEICLFDRLTEAE